MPAVFLTLLLAASSPEELARQAEDDFDHGLAARQDDKPSRHHFLAAVAAYEELRRQGANNASLEHNLGNAYLLADDLPRAILAYRRGLRLAPAHRALNANLTWARGQVIFLEGSALGRHPDDRPAWLPLAPRTLFLTSSIAYIAFCVGLTRWLMLRRSGALAAALAGFAVALGAALLLVLASRAEPAGPIVVIARNGVYSRKGDGRSFPPRYEVPLNRGVEARLLHRQNGWLQIELSGGEVGWVAESEAVVEGDE